jgi:hypothetical protein
MTEKRFELRDVLNENIQCDEISDNGEWITYGEIVDLLNALHEKDVKLKNSLREFEVFESNRIKGAVVTNNDFSITLHSNDEAYMVCNMVNRFIGSVKNGNKD